MQENPRVKQANPLRVILLAEDEGTVRRLLTTFLESQGHEVLAADDGDSAIQASEGHSGPIHLLITDIRMPGLNGKDLADKICKIRPGIRILYISGYNEIDGRHLTECNGKESFYLRKPFSMAALKRTMEEIFQEGVAVPEGR